MTANHDKSFPNEDTSYREARNALLDEEMALRANIERVASLRRALPRGGALKEDYVLTDGSGSEVRFSDLFVPGQDTLVVYSFMLAPGGNPCPACTSLIDGLDGMSPHIQQKVSFAVFAKAPISEFKAWGQSRGWQNVPLFSSGDTTYNADYHAEDSDQSQTPIINVFCKTPDGIFHSWASEMVYAPWPEGMHPRHADSIWPLWNVFDLTPEGRGPNWFPQVSYD